MTADVYETVDGDAYVVEVPVPGVDVNDISVEATPDDLTVSIHPSARDGQPGRRYLHHEQDQAPMSRVFEFPTDIDPDNISATLEAGMLKIHVPKAAASRRRRIPLKQQA